jgi:hypothetical protein
VTDKERAEFDARMAGYIAATQAVVTASHCEQHQLWCLYAEDSDMRSRSFDMRRLPWVQKNMGMWQTIATVDIGGEKMPVTVSLSWALVDGTFVCFLDATSQVVDWRIVEDWRRKTFPKARTSDAMNFHNALRPS